MDEIIKIKINPNKKAKRNSRNYFSECNMVTKVHKPKTKKKPKHKNKIYEEY